MGNASTEIQTFSKRNMTSNCTRQKYILGYVQKPRGKPELRGSFMPLGLALVQRLGGGALVDMTATVISISQAGVKWPFLQTLGSDTEHPFLRLIYF